MKKISFILILFTVACISQAQTPDEQKFIGTWKYTSNNTQFILLLKYGAIPNGTALLVFHRLIRNDSIAQNAIPLLPESGDYSTASGGVVLIPGEANLAKGGITDLELKKPGRIVLTCISSSQLRFQLFAVSGPQKNQGAPFRLPYDVVLAKQ